MEPLTDEENKVFEGVREAENMLLIRSRLDGEDVAVIAAYEENEDEFLLQPLAVLVTDGIMSRLEDPSRDVAGT